MVVVVGGKNAWCGENGLVEVVKTRGGGEKGGGGENRWWRW